MDSIRRITCFLSSFGVFRGDVTYGIQNSYVTVNIACELCATSISVTLVKRVELVNQTLLEEFIIQTSLLYFGAVQFLNVLNVSVFTLLCIQFI